MFDLDFIRAIAAHPAQAGGKKQFLRLSVTAIQEQFGHKSKVWAFLPKFCLNCQYLFWVGWVGSGVIQENPLFLFGPAGQSKMALLRAKCIFIPDTHPFTHHAPAPPTLRSGDTIAKRAAFTCFCPKTYAETPFCTDL